ncbi:ribonucleases P/MRP protein subunit POP1 [Colias croceus]|uniref:ribonucleases P/MRP protein subunit POP1 n=1 Tax=Colias crocea TaxID=72248 RepID=UPI001E27DFB7|nr:ribonucleases P/MRP protein subunit POP1 [Colias croceus]XP_045495917.1 ribonucleases P/MRP protein subunit POP1 [Colias croceus]
MDSKEFDATLGGAEHLPHTANSFKFAASRSVEIAAMTESILRPVKSKLIFQALPVHMRRRVMSHNCKRLPRRLREGHLEQLKKNGLPPKQKRPSRKYRRRPANLLEEYTRRQRRIVWLETHIWHAKRFHMVERWGYRLAHRPCDKAFRACYRASSAHCLLQDISYYIPVQVKGPVADIQKLFSCITNKSCGLSVSAKAYISGHRSGCINIYYPNSYPYDFIGKVEFVWVQTESQPFLILFVHPSQVKEVEYILTDIITCSTAFVAKNNDNKRVKLTNELLNVKIKLMYGNYNRFRLTGPKSHAVLTHSLKCVTDINNIDSNEWVAVAKTSNINLDLQNKSNYWSSINNLFSPAQVPPRIVIGLIVKDPRWSRPRKRTKAQTKQPSTSQDNLTSIPSYASSSPLWDENICNIVKKNAVSNTKFIDHVTMTEIVPGEVNEDDPALQSIPVVLIQQAGSQNSESKKIGYGSGWDIIVPSGYGIPFWLTFVMFGARTGGLRETENLAHEMGECYFSPDSNSGRIEGKRIEKQLKEHYFKRPPSKRVNYIKLGILNPFICPWNILLKDWSDTDVDKFFILRDKVILNELQESIVKKKQILNAHPVNTGSCLIAVYLKIEGKGVMRDHALICLPNVEDITSTKLLCEPHHEDTNAKLRKEKRKENKKLLKQLRRKRIKLRKTIKDVPDKKQKMQPSEPSEFVKSMQELWVPSNVISVRNSCIRQTMGYLTKGAFSFTEARSCGVGYIAYNALVKLLELKINKVLIRNPTSRKYRLASFRIIPNP